jgi:hypothetical protein
MTGSKRHDDRCRYTTIDTLADTPQRARDADD